MPDDTSQPDTPATQTAAPAAQPTAITPEIQALIDGAVKKAHDSAFAEARRMFEGKKAKPAEKEAAPAAPPSDEAATQLKLRDDLDDAVADMSLTAKQRKLMRSALLAEKPSNVAEWAKAYASDAGWSQEQTMTPGKPPTGRPASDGGSPAGVPAERPTDVLKWTQEDVERYYAQHAEVPQDMYDPRNAKVHRELRKMAKASLANVRIQLGPRR